jgi:hypothetical protein
MQWLMLLDLVYAGKSNTTAVIAIAVPVVAVMVLIIICIYLRARKSRKMFKSKLNC